MAAPSKFTPDIRASLIESFEAGASVPDAARASGVTERTLKGWLTKGRKEDSGDYAEFVAAVDFARGEAAGRVLPGDADELAIEVWRSVRRGSVAAMKLYWDILRATPDSGSGEEQPADPLAAVDELAERRRGNAV